MEERFTMNIKTLGIDYVEDNMSVERDKLSINFSDNAWVHEPHLNF